LYHINRDYRFPDQPIYEKETLLHVENKKGWQYWNIEEFNDNLEESKQFPENVYQRWFKIVVEDVYNKQSERISISEFYYQDEFLSPNEI
jgi:translation elongation factor EF-Tu-like GTPase